MARQSIFWKITKERSTTGEAGICKTRIVMFTIKNRFIMKIFMLLLVITFTISCQCTANEIKLSVIQCECEQTSMDNSENPDERDTITYVGVFGSIKDSVLIYNTTNDLIFRFLQNFSCYIHFLPYFYTKSCLTKCKARNFAEVTLLLNRYQELSSLL